MTGESPAGEKFSKLMTAIADTIEGVFIEEMKESVAFIIVAVNKKSGECGYVSNVNEIEYLIELMKGTVQRYEEMEKAKSKH